MSVNLRQFCGQRQLLSALERSDMKQVSKDKSDIRTASLTSKKSTETHRANVWRVCMAEQALDFFLSDFQHT